MSWEEKVQEVRVELNSLEASALVISALDEVAWLLNLRGNDIPYNPGKLSNGNVKQSFLNNDHNII